MTDESEPDGASLVDFNATGDVLADAVASALPGWVARSLRTRAAFSDAAVAEVTRAVLDTVMPPLRELVASDVDLQRTTPLTIVRLAVGPIGDALRQAGAATASRDRYDAQAFPDDLYALTPHGWVEISDALTEPALRWGVAKAFEHRRRHRT